MSTLVHVRNWLRLGYKATSFVASLLAGVSPSYLQYTSNVSYRYLYHR